jgi:ribosome assembly protein 1
VVPPRRHYLIVDMVVLKDSSLRRGTATITSPNGDITIRIRLRPLPTSVTDFLLKHTLCIKNFLLDRRVRIEEMDDVTESVSVQKRLSFDEFKKELETLLVAEGGEWRGILDQSSSTFYEVSL